MAYCYSLEVEERSEVVAEMQATKYFGSREAYFVGVVSILFCLIPEPLDQVTSLATCVSVMVCPVDG